MNEGAILRILRCYLETNVLNFSTICKQAGYPTDLGGYYIRHLVGAGCLVKMARGQYMITPYGKQQFLKLERKQGRTTPAQPRLCAMGIVKHGDKLVVIRRKQQPFIGFAEWPAATVPAGESLADSMQKLLQTRLGVSATVKPLGFFRRIDRYDAKVFDDKLFAVHACRLESHSPILKKSPYGENILVTPDELASITKPARALFDIYALSQTAIPYQERQYDLSPEDIVPTA